MTPNLVNEKSLLNSLNAGVVVHAANTKILYANPKALELLRLTPSQAYGRIAFDPSWRFVDKYKHVLTPEEFPVSLVLNSKTAISNQEFGICDTTDQKITWVSVNAYPEFDESGEIEQVVVTFVDITYQNSEIPFHDIVRSANDIIVVTDTSPKSVGGPFIVYVNEAYTKLSGYSADYAVGKSPKFLQGKKTDKATMSRIRKALNEFKPVRESIYNYAADGNGYWLDLNIFPLINELDQVTHFAAVERDVTENHALEELLIEQAVKDPLTDLLNRRGFFQTAEKLVQMATRKKEKFGVAMIDLDHFKAINDQFGHDTGDKYLQEFSELMQMSFRKTDLLARYGGEEFIIMLPDCDVKSCLNLLEKFRIHLCNNPIELERYPKSSTTISIGLAVSDPESNDLSKLISKADYALYQAKKNGRNRCCLAET